MVRMMGSQEGAMAAHSLKDGMSWWHQINESTNWQDRTFHLLATLYGFIALIAFLRLVLIQLRSPNKGWTIQKLFHVLNFMVTGIRCLVFVFRREIQSLHPEIIQHIFLDMPSLFFFTTYALLGLFWADIYYQARCESTERLTPSFNAINGAVYGVQAILWLLTWWNPTRFPVILHKIFFGGVSLLAALGFLLYGGRLFLMLHGFPIESKRKYKKLREVGYLTIICFSCFLIRCIMMGFNAFDAAADLDVLNHPILNLTYYLLVEILPCSLAFVILYKLPSKRRLLPPYHPIPTGDTELGS